MNRRDFFKLTGKVAIVASLAPEVLADIGGINTAIPKTSAKYEYTGEYFDFDYNYGLAVSIGSGKDRVRNAVQLRLSEPGKVSDTELKAMAESLNEWAKSQGYRGLPSTAQIIKEVRA